MALDDELGPFANHSIAKVNPAMVRESEREHYARWMAYLFGHALLFDPSDSIPSYMQRHVCRLSELKGLTQDQALDYLRTLYRGAVDQRADEFCRRREESPSRTFLAKRFQCYGVTATITSSLDDHLGIAPEQVNWGHVADIGEAKKYLDAAAYLLRVRQSKD